jgi:acyl carrier protein
MQNNFSSDNISGFIQKELAGFLSMPADSIDVDAPFDQFGIDSAKAILMVGKLEDLLNVELPSTLLWDHNTIKTLSNHLHQNLSQYQ